MKCEQFLSVLFFAVLFCSGWLLIEPPTEEQMERLHRKQEPLKCEKPCCHLLFNKYCEDCRNYER